MTSLPVVIKTCVYKCVCGKMCSSYSTVVTYVKYPYVHTSQTHWSLCNGHASLNWKMNDPKDLADNS
jgi:hypothetical protein